MTISDPVSLQTFFWLSAAVLATLLICVSIVGHRFAEAWGERSRANSSVQDAKTREAEAYARQAELDYDKELLLRAGPTPDISLNVDQATIDKLALDHLKKVIESMKVTVKT